MAKGEQRSNKMPKKPKKDSSTTSKPSVSDRPMPPVTTVIPRGKVKSVVFTDEGQQRAKELFETMFAKT